jgi:hypothetical protein
LSYRPVFFYHAQNFFCQVINAFCAVKQFDFFRLRGGGVQISLPDPFKELPSLAFYPVLALADFAKAFLS